MPNPLASQLWYIDFLTHPTPLIIPHRLPAFLESLMPLKNCHFSKLKCPHVQIAFLKFISCDNQTLVGCISIPALAVHLNLKS